MEAIISMTRFYSGQMDQIDLGIVKIGGSLDGINVVGDPKFIVDFNMVPPTAAIDIEALSRSILQSGLSKFSLEEGFEFSSRMNIPTAPCNRCERQVGLGIQTI